MREKTHDNIYIANAAVSCSNSNKEIAAQLEAIRSYDGRRPILTPDDLGVFLRDDDAISRVVSQVRKNEDGEDNSAEATTTNHNYKFEIERTDSLEFTRNSETNEPFEVEEENELTMLSGGGKSRRSTVDKRKQLDNVNNQQRMVRHSAPGGQNDYQTSRKLLQMLDQTLPDGAQKFRDSDMTSKIIMSRTDEREGEEDGEQYHEH